MSLPAIYLTGNYLSRTYMEPKILKTEKERKEIVIYWAMELNGEFSEEER